MKSKRRLFIKIAGVGGLCAAALGAGMLKPRHAAAAWSDSVFQTAGLENLLASIGATGARRDERITIDAPEIASNGSMVPVTLTSEIPQTEWAAIVAEKNPFPLLGVFEFQNGAHAFASTRIKLRDTSLIQVIVKAGDGYFINERLVKVTIGGCGG